MKTAEELMMKWAGQPSGPVPISTTVKLTDLRAALNDAHLAGMTEAAVVAGNAVRSEKDYSQNFARDKCLKAIVAARDAKALAAKEGK